MRKIAMRKGDTKIQNPRHKEYLFRQYSTKPDSYFVAILSLLKSNKQQTQNKKRPPILSY